MPKTMRMTEAQLTGTLIDACKIYGFRVSHFRPARTERGWRTAVEGHKGFPDLAIAGYGTLLLVELKVGRNSLSLDQAVWRSMIPAENYRLWTERDLPAALAELRALSNHRPTEGDAHVVRFPSE